VGKVDLSSGSIEEVDLPALRRLASLRPLLSPRPEAVSEPAVHPKTFDLLFLRHRSRTNWNRDLWYMDRSGRHLRRLLSFPSAGYIDWFVWHPNSPGAYAVTSPHTASASAHSGVWWLPVATSEGSTDGNAAQGPAKLLSGEYGRFGRSDFSDDGRWLLLWALEGTDEDRTQRPLLSRHDGSSQWRVPAPPKPSRSASWSPAGARLAIVDVSRDGEITVSVCEPESRTLSTVARFRAPFPGTSAWTVWSSDGSRVLVRVIADEGPHASRSSTPFQTPRRKRRGAAYDVVLANGRVTRVFGPVEWEDTLSMEDWFRGNAPKRTPPWPRFMGYDGSNKVILVQGKKIVRIDPETGARDSVLEW